MKRLLLAATAAVSLFVSTAIELAQPVPATAPAPFAARTAE